LTVQSFPFPLMNVRSENIECKQNTRRIEIAGVLRFGCCASLHKVDFKSLHRDALTWAIPYPTLIAHLQRHTLRKKGSQSHRSKGFSYDSGVASMEQHTSIVRLHEPPTDRAPTDLGADLSHASRFSLDWSPLLGSPWSSNPLVKPNTADRKVSSARAIRG